jgi:hypothetical protein
MLLRGRDCWGQSERGWVGSPLRGQLRHVTGMIFHRHKTIFLHIGKTAGSAIERYFVPGPRDPMVANRHLLYGYDKELGIYLQHASLATTRAIVGTKTFERSFTFSIVRDPYARLASIFNYNYKQHRKTFGSFETFVRNLPRLATRERALRGTHPIPQIRYTHQDGEQALDFIGKFEQLDIAMSELEKRMNLDEPARLPPKPQPVLQGHPATIASYDDEMIAIMQEVYREDFDILGYSDTPNREAGDR